MFDGSSVFSLTCLSHVGKDGTVGAAEFAAGLTSMGINTESRQAVLWLWFLILIREKKTKSHRGDPDPSVFVQACATHCAAVLTEQRPRRL